ncbi:caspase family protein [Lentzea albida]|uniref:Caspase domain-containing protein n=1 Tax=Lentzea albida TaxID=65499 RepID=A0A1H9MVE4_9PSEU|nr:caspase family protein [Lentzea albida]SER27487.1 Caspase domain-containing protein [Lentzea albida]
MLDSRAVLVGTSTYVGGLPQLDQAAANLTDLHDVLLDVVDTGGLHLFTDPVAARLVLDRLDGCASSPASLLLFYYAGHGLRDQDDRLCLALPGSVDTPRDARRTSLPLDSVLEIMKHAKARHRVVVLDCCYSGLALDSPAAADLHLLTATNRTTKAAYRADARNTEFTGELVRVLDGPGPLDLGGIYRELDRALTARGQPRPRQRCVDHSADFVLRP